MHYVVTCYRVESQSTMPWFVKFEEGYVVHGDTQLDAERAALRKFQSDFDAGRLKGKGRGTGDLSDPRAKVARVKVYDGAADDWHKVEPILTNGDRQTTT